MVCSFFFSWYFHCLYIILCVVYTGKNMYNHDVIVWVGVVHTCGIVGTMYVPQSQGRSPRNWALSLVPKRRVIYFYILLVLIVKNAAMTRYMENF